MPARNKLPLTTYVKHKSKPIEGRIIGQSRLKDRFEQAGDEFEYRVQTETGIELCSLMNLIAISCPHCDALLREFSEDVLRLEIEVKILREELAKKMRKQAVCIELYL